MPGHDVSGHRPDPTEVKELFGLVLEAAQQGEDTTTNGEAEALAAQARQAMDAAEDTVRHAVERLLAAHQRASGVLFEDTSNLSSLEESQDALTQEPLPSIPGYDIGEELGRGGFGVVYKAEQRHPVQRPVAVKILRAELASPSVISRFRTESRVLARMNHRGIASVLDAGLDVHNRPFVVMELVEGKPLIEHCEQHQLSVRERVRVMIAVCEAVHHAHQRAVIHRDLKPANILVEHIDSHHRPRVIDFGIARLLEADANETRTQEGTRLGTPRYMSPEQAAGTDAADVRTDVYALGVLSCELLTNSVPRQQHQTDSGSSSRSRTRATRPSQLAAKGNPSIAQRSSELRGDLDRIVLKAVALEPDERYDSAALLADDLQRYLEGRPVQATPPGMVYLARKFVGRYKIASAAIALSVVSMIGGTIAATYGLARATESRIETEQALAEAQRERARAEAVAEFLLGDMLDVLNPDHTGDSDRDIRTLLRYVAHEAETRLAGEPAFLLDVLTRLGAAMNTLTDFQSAADTYSRAASLAMREYGQHDRRTLNLRLDALVAGLSARQIEGSVATITSILDDAMEVYGRDDPITLRARLHEAHVVAQDDPIQLMRDVVNGYEASGYSGSEGHLEALRYLGAVMDFNEHPEARRFLTQAAEIAAQRLGWTHSLAIQLRMMMGRAAERRGEYADAQQILREVQETAMRQFGPANIYSYRATAILIQVAHAQERVDEAYELAQAFTAMAIRREGIESMGHATALRTLGEAAMAIEAHEEAVAAYTQAIAFYETLEGPTYVTTLAVRIELARAYAALDQHDGIASLLQPVLSHLPKPHADRIDAVVLVADSLVPLQGIDAARAYVAAERDAFDTGSKAWKWLDAWLLRHP